MSTRTYILDDNGNPIPEPDSMKAFARVDLHGRRVARDDLPGGGYVSTVFLVIDHGFSPDGPPLLFGYLKSGVGPATSD